MGAHYDVTPRQLAFLNADADEVLFGGAAGGGKSYGQLIDALIFAAKYAGSKQLLLRRTFPELEKSLIRVSLELFPREMYKYNSSKHTGTFVNGSIIDFGYCDNENDVFKYQSSEYDVIRFDELTHFTKSMYIYLTSRCRGANDFPKQIKSSTNPGGVGHTWVKERFIDIGPPDTLHKFENGSRIFLPSKIQDNFYLMKNDPGYLERLKRLDEKDQKALLYGDWDIFDGQYFAEFDRSMHVAEPFEIPSWWRRYFFMDYGLDMLAGFEAAVDDMGRAYVIKEIYEGKDSGGDGLIVSEAAAKIKEMLGNDKIVRYFAPPDLWNRQKDTGKSIADLFRSAGIPLSQVSNDRVSGWMTLKEWIKPEKQEDGVLRPRLRIFPNCVNLIRTLPAVQFDAKNPNDVAREPHEMTHAPDALRYFVSGYVSSSKKPTPPPTYNFSFEKPKNNFLHEKTRRI